MAESPRHVAAFAAASGRSLLSVAQRSSSCAFVPRCSPRGLTSRHSKRSRGSRFLDVMCVSNSSSDSSSYPGLDPEQFSEEELKGLELTTLKWCEIPFESLEEELTAIDVYAKEEELDDDNAWARFLRGAAYEHWGRPSLAAAQYHLVRYSKGLRLIPELWLRKAYNAFKLGDVALANRMHDIARLIEVEAVGNQMHFSFWFETEFKDFKPRHNGPPFAVQSAICNYSCEMFADARFSLCSLLCTMLGSQEDLEHAGLWLLATSARVNSTIAVDVTGLPPDDVVLAKKALDGASHASQPVSEALAPIAALYLDGSPACLEKTEEIVNLGGEHGATRALYMALFYDSLARDEKERDRWLDVLSDMNPPKVTHGNTDFMYWTGQNRFTVPPGSKTELPPLQVPL